jgi:hypothetical protein
MADSTNNPSGFDPAKIERVSALLQQLKEDARQAYEAGDLYMLSVYNKLLHAASPIVVKAHTRMEREQRANFNKREKTLRVSAKEERDKQNGNQKKSTTA